VLGKPGLRPCTPVGCVILAKTERPDLTGANVVVIGRSILVGKPAALLFLEQNASVTIAHSKTRDLKMVCRGADILVAAVGRPEMVRGDWVRPGAIVIDVGTNRVPAPEKGEGKTKLVGDVAFKEAIEIAAAVSPSPGGVGPMTIACLLRNTVLAACARRGGLSRTSRQGLNAAMAPNALASGNSVWEDQQRDWHQYRRRGLRPARPAVHAQERRTDARRAGGELKKCSARSTSFYSASAVSSAPASSC
jgi:hypothetical protein